MLASRAKGGEGREERLQSERIGGLLSLVAAPLCPAQASRTVKARLARSGQAAVSLILVAPPPFFPVESRWRRNSVMESTDTPEEDELARRRAEEYEMQLFGLHSRTVCTAIHQKIKENVDVQCQKIYKSIQRKYNPDAKQTEILKENIRQLRKQYEHNMQPHLKTIENVVHKFINIPDNILLKEDECQSKQYTDEEFEKLEKKLESLQKEAKRVTTFNAVLKEEYETLEKLKETEDMAKKLCNIINKGLSNTNKIKTETLQAVDKIKGLTESLQPMTQKSQYNPKVNICDLEQINLE